MKKLRYLLTIFVTTEGDAPVGDSPAGDPPVDTPPVNEPPAGDDPPADAPPADAPPADAPKDEAAAPVVPEAYTFTAPEGVEFDQATFDGFTNELGAVAKELGLTQEQAQGMAAFATKFDVNRGVSSIDSAKEIFASDNAAWKAEIGNAKAQEAITNSDKILKGFATEGFSKLLDDTGLRSSPDIIRTFAAIGAAIGEDSIPRQHKSADSTLDTRQAKLAQLYPTMAPKS